MTSDDILTEIATIIDPEAARPDAPRSAIWAGRRFRAWRKAEAIAALLAKV